MNRANQKINDSVSETVLKVLVEGQFEPTINHARDRRFHAKNPSVMFCIFAVGVSLLEWKSQFCIWESDYCSGSLIFAFGSLIIAVGV